eukprot:GHVN01107235.1.p1 GENE.GHVN01107235.1~~GHVN01107235.1.p1  ORF type:complete len:762 (-),score=182.06 GHVN01107235.1:648-2933(-)
MTHHAVPASFSQKPDPEVNTSPRTGPSRRATGGARSAAPGETTGLRPVRKRKSNLENDDDYVIGSADEEEQGEELELEGEDDYNAEEEEREEYAILDDEEFGEDDDDLDGGHRKRSHSQGGKGSTLVSSVSWNQQKMDPLQRKASKKMKFPQPPSRPATKAAADHPHTGKGSSGRSHKRPIPPHSGAKRAAPLPHGNSPSSVDVVPNTSFKRLTRAQANNGIHFTELPQLTATSPRSLHDEMDPHDTTVSPTGIDRPRPDAHSPDPQKSDRPPRSRFYRTSSSASCEAAPTKASGMTLAQKFEEILLKEDIGDMEVHVQPRALVEDILRHVNEQMGPQGSAARKQKLADLHVNLKRYPHLRQLLLVGAMSAEALVKANTKDLAPQELKQKRELEQEKYFKENVVLEADPAAPLIRKTHKGDEFIVPDSEAPSAIREVVKEPESAVIVRGEMKSKKEDGRSDDSESDSDSSDSSSGGSGSSTGSDSSGSSDVSDTDTSSQSSMEKERGKRKAASLTSTPSLPTSTSSPIAAGSHLDSETCGVAQPSSVSKGVSDPTGTGIGRVNTLSGPTPDTQQRANGCGGFDFMSDMNQSNAGALLPPTVTGASLLPPHSTQPPHSVSQVRPASSHSQSTRTLIKPEGVGDVQARGPKGDEWDDAGVESKGKTGETGEAGPKGEAEASVKADLKARRKARLKKLMDAYGLVRFEKKHGLSADPINLEPLSRYVVLKEIEEEIDKMADQIGIENTTRLKGHINQLSDTQLT